MALNDVEHGGELAALHGVLFAIGELDPELIEGAGVPVIEEPCDGHRLAGEHRLIANAPFVQGHGSGSLSTYRASRGHSGNRQRGAVSFWPRKFSTACASSTNSAARLSCSCSM